MARKSNALPFPKPLGASTTSKPVIRPISDADRLILERFLSAQDAVIQQANVAADQFVRAVMKLAELDPEEGWKFNRDKMRWEKHPVTNAQR